jgi:hypothetical protein
MADSVWSEWIRNVTGIGGLVLAAPLAGLRIYEFFKDRAPRLSVLVELSDDANTGNTITLLNASKIPANILYFDLIWVQRGPFGKNIRLGRKITRENEPLEGETCNITVGPHSQRALVFAEQDHFGWGAALSEDIYLRLWLIGRRSPRWFWVTGPR